jgi:hypothetical protein
MANSNTYSWRNIALGVVAAIVVLLVILWLAGAFEATTEQPLTEAPETETTTPEPEPEEPQPESEEQQQQ